MLEIRAHHPCEIGDQEALTGLPSPQTLVLPFVTDGTAYIPHIQSALLECTTAS
jgi:hypothetical protein